MDLGLNGMNVAITGGSRGIGRAIATRLLDEGARVSISARGKDGVDEAVGALTSHGTVIGAALDAANREELSAWIVDSAERLGGLDIYIANASGGGGGQTEEKFEASFQVDMMGLVRGVQAALPYLEQSSGGSVIMIGTTAAIEQFGPGATSYMSMKAGAIAYGSALAKDLAAKGIRVNSVSPGPILFDGGPWDRIRDAKPEFFDATLAMSPRGRLGTAEEIANVVAFVASPAASWVTGQNLVVDGGFTRRHSF